MLALVQASVDALAHAAVVPRRVLALVRDAVPEPAHGLAHGRGLCVFLVIEPLDARLVLAHRLGVRGARPSRLEAARDHLAQTRGLVEDRVPVADHLMHPRQRVRLGQLENARLLLGWQKALVELPMVPPVAGVEPLGLPRLEVVVDLVRVHGPLGEPTTPAVLFRAPTRDAALAHRVHGHRRAVAQPSKGRQPTAKAAGERTLLRLEREHRRERRHRAAANVAQRVEMVGRGRLGPRLPVLPLGAQVPIRGARGLQVEPPEPRVQDAVRAVHVVVRDARLRGVVAHVAGLVVAALGELATKPITANGVRHPHHRLLVLVVLFLLVGVVLLLLQLATKVQRLLGLGAATAGLEDGIGTHAVLDLLLLVGAPRLGSATGRLLREESHGARGAEQALGHAGACQPIDVTLEPLRRQPVRLGDVVQCRSTEALDVCGPRMILGMPLGKVAARWVGVQLGRDDVDAHLQPRAAHLGRLGMPGLVQSARDGGGPLACRLARMNLTKARPTLLTPVGHAGAAAVAQRLAHVLLEHAFAMRTFRIGVGLLGRTLGRQLLADEHPREHATHQGKVRPTRVRRVGVLAIHAHVATILGPVAACVHLKPELGGDGVRRQGSGAVLGHDNHVAGVVGLQMHRVFGGRHGRWLLVLLLLQSPSAVARGWSARPRGQQARGLDESIDLGEVPEQQRISFVSIAARKIDDSAREQDFVGLGELCQARRERHGRRGAHVHGHLGGDLAEADGRGDAVGHRAALVSATAAANLGLDESQRFLIVATSAAERGIAAGTNGAPDAPVVLGARGAAQRVLDQDVDHGLDGHREQLRRPVGVVVGGRRLVGIHANLTIVQQRPVVAPVAPELAREPRAHGVHGDGLAVVGDGDVGLAGLGERHRQAQAARGADAVRSWRRATCVQPPLVRAMVNLDKVPPPTLVSVWDLVHWARMLVGTAALIGVTTLVLGGLLANATYEFGRIARSILRGDIIL